MRKTQSYEPQFGIFVGLYNKLTGTKFSVKKALKNESIISLYEMTQEVLESSAAAVKSEEANKPRTRRKALDKLDASRIDVQVYQYLKKHPNCSRFEIAEALGMRVSSICSAVARLQERRAVRVAGTSIDPTTDREVEVLAVRKRR